MKYTVNIKKKDAIDETHLCFIRIMNEEGGQIIYPVSYFTCDLENNIIQAPTWFLKSKDYIRQVKKLGYKLEASFQKSLSSDE